MTMAPNPHTIASEWLARCATDLGGVDIDAAADLFLPDGWLRDVLAFTWDIRSFQGRNKIASYLTESLVAAHISEVRLDETAELAPRAYTLPHTRATGVEVSFKFECRHGHGRGHAKLLCDTDGVFRAFTVLTTLSDLVGHEEADHLRFRDDLSGVPVREMHKGLTNWVHDVETKPYALIVGAGQTGVQVAARFKQMNIPTLVIERQPRVGDIWRNRYPSLTLHTVRRHHSLLYQPFPYNWPKFTPRDKLADWLECYATTQDLTVWTSTEFKGRPTYCADSQDWDVTVVRDGVEVKLRPAHIVLATGTFGKPYMPDIPDAATFSGTALHSVGFNGGAPYAGKRVVVIGAGSSSIDICHELVIHGAQSATMIQRSPTCVVSREFQGKILQGLFPEDVPLDVADFRLASTPFALIKQFSVKTQQDTFDAHAEMHAKLRKGDLQVDLGPEGQGIFSLFLERGGKYWIIKDGIADMFEDGRIKVHSDVSIQRFTSEGIVLSDGFELPADVVIFATGFTNIRESSEDMFGDEVVDKLDEIWGLDEEGEIKGSYRPCGHPGLWFATGDISNCRFLSKPLALQIKAIQLGMLQHDGSRGGAVTSSL